MAGDSHFLGTVLGLWHPHPIVELGVKVTWEDLGIGGSACEEGERGEGRGGGGYYLAQGIARAGNLPTVTSSHNRTPNDHLQLSNNYQLSNNDQL